MRYYDVLYREAAALGSARLRKTPSSPVDEEGSDLDLVDGGFPDWLSSDTGMRLCSPAMRSALDSSATSRDRLEWSSKRVHSGPEVREYWQLALPMPLINSLGAGTIRAGDFVVKPVFRRSALDGHAVFTYVEGGDRTLMVDQATAKKLRRCTGLECSAVPLVEDSA